MNLSAVYVVILSYNGKKLTLDCIQSCLRQTYPNYFIILIDNNSADDSVSAISIQYEKEIAQGKLVVVKNAVNLGFAGGNNIGIEIAIRSGADYVFLLNNDTVVDDNCISEMTAFLESHPGVGLAAPKIYYFEPRDQIWFAGAELSLARGVSKHIGIREKDTGQYNWPLESDYITGCAMMIRKSVIDKIGMLDTRFYMYAEDVDYSLRAKKAGFQLWYVPQGKIWHKISSAMGGNLRFRKVVLRLQSQFLLFRRHARWYHWLSIPVFYTLDSIRIMALILTGKIRN